MAKVKSGNRVFFWLAVLGLLVATTPSENPSDDLGVLVGVNFGIAIFSTLLNFVGNLFFIPVFGVVGAAIATSFSFFMNLIVRLLIFSRFSGSDLISCLIIRAEDWKLLRSVFSKQRFKV